MASYRLIGFPYKSQLDNVDEPYGTCNTTSIAMCLEYWGVISPNKEVQLEDYLTDLCYRNGWDRHSPHDLQRVVEHFGLTDCFTDRGTIGDITKALDKGTPCVIHGYFTRSGHVIAVCGYDQTGLIVNDPYGEWYETGYLKNDLSHPTRGKELHYSYSMINSLCSPETNPSASIWLHRVYKK